MAGTPWHQGYEERRHEVLALQKQYYDRCTELGADPRKIKESVSRELVTRIVHESNWQEDLYLDAGRTRELADAVFDDPIGIKGPRLDMQAIVKAHRDKAIQLVRGGASNEELAAYNLSRSHEAVRWIAGDAVNRHVAQLCAIFEEVAQRVKESGDPAAIAYFTDTPTTTILHMGVAIRANPKPVQWELPMRGGERTFGEYMSGLIDLGSRELTKPVEMEYLHFLHRLTLMGLLAASKCGVFRKTPVHVSGNSDLFFPPPEVVPGLMQEFCNGLYLIIKWGAVLGVSDDEDACREAREKYITNFDRIKEAAWQSYRFVRIHPYSDGNGRMSRLVMNMVLLVEHPPVYLKADAKGRHRYSWALRKADRGDITPLACLIANSLKQTYKRLLDSVKPPPAR